MRGYYWAVARRLPGLLVESGARATTLIGVVATLLALVNREAAQAVTNWDGLSPAWAVVPFALLLVYGLLKANYEAFDAIRAQIPKVDLTRMTDRGLATRLDREATNAAEALAGGTPAHVKSEHFPGLIELCRELERRGFVGADEIAELEATTDRQEISNALNWLWWLSTKLKKGS